MVGGGWTLLIIHSVIQLLCRLFADSEFLYFYPPLNYLLSLFIRLISLVSPQHQLVCEVATETLEPGIDCAYSYQSIRFINKRKCTLKKEGIWKYVCLQSGHMDATRLNTHKWKWERINNNRMETLFIASASSDRSIGKQLHGWLSCGRPRKYNLITNIVNPVPSPNWHWHYGK